MDDSFWSLIWLINSHHVTYIAIQNNVSKYKFGKTLKRHKCCNISIRAFLRGLLFIQLFIEKAQTVDAAAFILSGLVL